ncbi:hypothetical protein FOA24_19230 [Bacillus thuringiensis]|uniref:hypothetical protein n=1 Tax=Bacillus thuringiensis TaxID=1428 RepID=UPI00333B7EA4
MLVEERKEINSGFLKKFSEEKKVENEVHVIIHNGRTFIIETQALISMFPKFKESIRERVERGLKIVDLVNGDINEFLRKEAELYVKANF